MSPPKWFADLWGLQMPVCLYLHTTKISKYTNLARGTWWKLICLLTKLDLRTPNIFIPRKLNILVLIIRPMIFEYSNNRIYLFYTDSYSDHYEQHFLPDPKVWPHATLCLKSTFSNIDYLSGYDQGARRYFHILLTCIKSFIIVKKLG